MSQFWLYFNLGLEYVLDWQAYNHVLFIIVLVAAYSFNEWKKILGLLGIFITGLLFSLVLATYQVVIVKPALINLLIPLTIIFTAVYNLFTASKKPRKNKMQLLYFTTLFFGLVHGLGFSTYFRTVLRDVPEKAIPLLEFTLGIVAAQLIIVIVVLLLSFLFQLIFRISRRDWVLVISSIVIGMIFPIIIEHIFW